MKKQVINQFIQNLKTQFQEEEEISITNVFQAWLEYDGSGGFGARCSQVSFDDGYEKLSYFPDYNKFLYSGENSCTEFGLKETFALTRSQIKNVPQGLVEALKEVAITGTNRIVYLNQNGALLIGNGEK